MTERIGPPRSTDIIAFGGFRAWAVKKRNGMFLEIARLRRTALFDSEREAKDAIRRRGWKSAKAVEVRVFVEQRG